MQIREVIYAVLEPIADMTDDLRINKRMVYFELCQTRAELIKQELNRSKYIDASFAQTLRNFKLISSNISDSTYSTPYPLLKSELPLPKVIEYTNGPSIFGIFTMSGRKINFTSRQTWAKKKLRRENGNDAIWAFIYNNHLFVDGYQDLDEMEVDVNAFFSDPAIVGTVQRKCDGESLCLPVYYNDFFIPADLSRRIVEITRQVFFRKLGLPIDTQNNSKQDNQQPENVSS